MYTSYKMNWRKVAGTFTVAAFALFALMGCKKDGTKDEKTTLSINPTSIAFNDAGAGSRTVQIKTSAKAGELSPIPSVSWVKATLRGTTAMNVEVEANPSENPREGQVTLQTVDGVTATLSITQVGLSPTLNVDKANVEAAAAGQTINVTVTSNIEWAAECAEDWIEAASNEDGSVLTIVVAQSPLFEAREGKVSLTPIDASFEKYAKEITVKQVANEYSITVTSDQIAGDKVSMNAGADDIVLSLVANSAWTITSEQDWIKADPAEGGITPAEGVEVVVGIDENPVTDERTGAFTIKCGTAEKTISVTQRGAGLFLEVENSDKTQMFTDAGGEISFTVSTNGTLTAKADASWITASVENGNTVKISVGSNAGEKQTGKVTLTAAQEGMESIFVEITVTQFKYATDLSASETANCYIVKQAGTYKFNAKVMGNGKSTDRYVAVAKELNPSAASLVWSTVDTSVNKTAITDIEYANGYIYFTTDGTEQNTVLAAKEVVKDNFGNESSFVVWSWHLWITNYDPNEAVNQYEVLDGNNDQGLPGTWAWPATWMSRNLGAFSDGGVQGNQNYEDVYKSFGLLYQWGRKDPFPGADYPNWGTMDDQWNFGGGGATNATIYYYDNEDGIVTNSSGSIKTQEALYESTLENVQYAIEHPSTYVRNASNFYAWITNVDNSVQIAPDDLRDGWGHLWGNPTDDNSTVGEKSIYDPCPAGWQVPHAMNFKFVTSHGDASAIGWAGVGPYRMNCMEMWEAYTGVKGGSVVPASTVDGNRWPSGKTTKLNFATFKGGLNFFIQDKMVAGEVKETLTIKTNDAGETLTEPATFEVVGIEACPSGETMFMPAAGSRTYAGGLVRVGSSLRYHANQPRGIDPTSWVSRQTRRMECDVVNGFYWGYGSDYNQQGSACSVRCIKTPETL